MPEATDPGSSGPDKSLENALSQMIWGYRTSHVILAVRLGIPDLLEDEAKTSKELAAAARVDPQALHRLLVVLTSVGVLREAGPARFALTPMGAFLQKQKTLRDSAILAESYWPALAPKPRHAALEHPAQQELALHEPRQARPVAGLRHRVQDQERLQMRADHLVEHGVLGVSRAIHGHHTRHAPQ